MQTTRMSRLLTCVITCTLMAAALPVLGQTATPPTTAPAADGDTKPLKPEEFEQLTAPIALYPDSLLAQVLMASTYPVEVVQAERWATANKALTGDALALELNKKDWDPSVKSLVNFPQVLDMMSKELDWTTKLGDAFIADQAATMAAVQRLRAKAQAQGNLKDSEQQKITIEQAPPQTVVVQNAPPQIITIESASPTVVYVPTYNPAVVYGYWSYPAYPPPAPYYPPGYVASNLLSFGAGVAIGAAWGNAWGGCNWHGGNVDVDINRNTNINRNVNRDASRQNIQNNAANRQGNRAGQGGAQSFQHDPSHRKGVSYRDQSTANRVGQSSADRNAAQARESYRGRAESGRQDIARGGASDYRGNAGAGANRGPSAGQQPANRALAGSNGNAGAGQNRPAGQPNRGATPSPSPAQNRPAPTQSRNSAMSGVNNSGSQTRASSSRGASSRSSSSAPRSTGGGSRGGGGGRGGGGRR